MPLYYTIRKTAIYTGVPEHILRKMKKVNELPGFSSGNRFYVNVEQLQNKLADNSVKIPTMDN